MFGHHWSHHDCQLCQLICWQLTWNAPLKDLKKKQLSPGLSTWKMNEISDLIRIWNGMWDFLCAYVCARLLHAVCIYIAKYPYRYIYIYILVLRLAISGRKKSFPNPRKSLPPFQNWRLDFQGMHHLFDQICNSTAKYWVIDNSLTPILDAQVSLPFLESVSLFVLLSTCYAQGAHHDPKTDLRTMLQTTTWDNIA